MDAHTSTGPAPALAPFVEGFAATIGVSLGQTVASHSPRQVERTALPLLGPHDAVAAMDITLAARRAKLAFIMPARTYLASMSAFFGRELDPDHPAMIDGAAELLNIATGSASVRLAALGIPLRRSVPHRVSADELSAMTAVGSLPAVTCIDMDIASIGPCWLWVIG